MELQDQPNREPSPTPRWKRIAALFGAIFMIYLTLACAWALATGRMFWI